MAGSSASLISVSRPGYPMPQTWQVERATFDQLLLRHAAACGADVRQRHRVVDVACDDDGVTATVQQRAGQRQAVRAHAIVDASGRGAFLSRKFELRVDEPRLANLAIFSHYSGVPRLEGRRAGTSESWPGRIWDGSGSSRSRVG